MAESSDGGGRIGGAVAASEALPPDADRVRFPRLDEAARQALYARLDHIVAVLDDHPGTLSYPERVVAGTAEARCELACPVIERERIVAIVDHVVRSASPSEKVGAAARAFREELLARLQDPAATRRDRRAG